MNTQADFQAYIAKLQEQRNALQKRIEDALSICGAFEGKLSDGRTVIVTESIRNPGLYQISHLDRRGEPTGHIDSRLDELAREVRGYGKLADDGEADEDLTFSR